MKMILRKYLTLPKYETKSTQEALGKVKDIAAHSPFYNTDNGFPLVKYKGVCDKISHQIKTYYNKYINLNKKCYQCQTSMSFQFE